jgi:hypothetical protein
MLSPNIHNAAMRLFSCLFYGYLLLLTTSCAVRPKNEFNPAHTPPPPDFSNLDNWAAHPDKTDMADRTPLPSIQNLQQNAAVDVLFFYPTTYTGSKRRERQWNADATDAATNKKTDGSSILFQASLFNGAGRVFAPRYRQAHLNVFYNKKRTESGKKALEIAYTDVEAAFDYYLQHWNNGRPFIIAAHSQGALHAMNLIKKRIEGKPLLSQLVAAYIVGWPVQKNFFTTLPACEKPDQTHCFCTWRTWDRHYVLKQKNDARLSEKIWCTNPLNWTVADDKYAAKAENKGGVIRPYSKIYPGVTDAEVYKGVLLASKPKFKGSFLFTRKNYHIGDLNLYYMNVRENAQLRSEAFFRR